MQTSPHDLNIAADVTANLDGSARVTFYVNSQLVLTVRRDTRQDAARLVETYFNAPFNTLRDERQKAEKRHQQVLRGRFAVA